MVSIAFKGGLKSGGKMWLPAGSSPTAKMGVLDADGNPSIQPLGEKAAKTKAKEKAKPGTMSQADFEKEAMATLNKINFETNADGMVAISDLRKAMGNRVSREDFDRMVSEMHSKDIVTFDRQRGTSLEGKARDAELESGGIKRPIGEAATFLSFSPQKEAKPAKAEQGRKAPAIKKAAGPKITSQSNFDKEAMKELKFLDKQGNHKKLVPIYELRRRLGDRVSRTEFNNMLLEMHAKGKIELMSGSFPDITPDKVADSVKSRLGSMYYSVSLEP